MIKEILYRQLFLVPLLCGFLIQCLKVIVYSVAEKKVNLVKFVQADGMPNLHSAVFSSMSTGIGIKYGFSSIVFSLMATYSMINDTMRIKGEKGKQVHVLNTILSGFHGKDEFRWGNNLRVLRFKPFDVMSGVVLGILSAILVL